MIVRMNNKLLVLFDDHFFEHALLPELVQLAGLQLRLLSGVHGRPQDEELVAVVGGRGLELLEEVDGDGHGGARLDQSGARLHAELVRRGDLDLVGQRARARVPQLDLPYYVRFGVGHLENKLVPRPYLTGFEKLRIKFFAI
jgi:hypothetical protein